MTFVFVSRFQSLIESWIFSLMNPTFSENVFNQKWKIFWSHVIDAGQNQTPNLGELFYRIDSLNAADLKLRQNLKLA